jgi:hypothetical protein
MFAESSQSNFGRVSDLIFRLCANSSVFFSRLAVSHFSLLSVKSRLSDHVGGVSPESRF